MPRNLPGQQLYNSCHCHCSFSLPRPLTFKRSLLARCVRNFEKTYKPLSKRCAAQVLRKPKPTGSAAHRIGGRSFPSQSGTVPLHVDPDVATEVTTGPKQAVQALRETMKERVRSLLQPLQEEAKALAALGETCRKRVRSESADVLHLSQALRDCGPWQVHPGHIQTCVRIFEAQQECSEVADSVEGLADKWHDRHVVIEKPKKEKIRGLQLPFCLREGTCHCSRNASSKRLRSLWLSARKMLQKLFREKSETVLLQNGYVVLLWVGMGVSSSSSASSTSHPQYRVTHVACMYLRPWRPTFVELTPPSASQQDDLRNVFPDCRSCTAQQPVYLTMQMFPTASGAPPLHTFLGFLDTLDRSLQWSVAVMKLSDRMAPFPDSVGLVKVVVTSGTELHLVWDGQGGTDTDFLFEDEPAQSSTSGGEVKFKKTRLRTLTLM